MDVSRRLNCREAWSSQKTDCMNSINLDFSFLPKSTWMGCWYPQLPLEQRIHLMPSQKLPHHIPAGKSSKGRTGLRKLCPNAANDWGLKSIGSSKQINSMLFVSQLNNWIWEGRTAALDLKIWNRGLVGKERTGEFIVSHPPCSFPYYRNINSFQKLFNYSLLPTY